MTGFTLVELLVAMTIGLVVLAGIIGMFVSQSKVNNSESSRLELISDLQLASQIVRSELHLAQDVYLGCSGKIYYRPMDSASAISTSCSTPQASNGLFKLESAANCTQGAATTTTTGCICWDRPDISGGCQELIRSINPSTGLSASKDSYGVVQVDIYGQYMGVDHTYHDLATRITVWPRNQ